MPLELTYYPDPILRKRADPVARIDGALRERVEKMFRIMYEHHGIGLAAPQVSWNARLFIVNVAGDPEEGEERVYINPQILGAEEEDTDEEGCLSIPDVRGKVTRSRKIQLKAQALDGEWFTEEIADLHARAVQHEIDHLDGILFIQRLGAAEQLLIKRALKDLEKNPPERRASSAS